MSEEIDTHDWDQFEKDWALSAGIALNAVFLIARANSRPNASRITDDVFGDDGGVPWLSWFVCPREAPCCLSTALFWLRSSALEAWLIVAVVGILRRPLASPFFGL